MDPLAITSGVQALTGLIQTGVGLFGGRRARKQLESLQSPTYSPVKSISDYYTEAKQRYNLSPYASTLYNAQMQDINRGTAQGIAGLQSRRLGIGGISSLIQGKNDAMLRAGVAAEQQREQRFGQLGAASQAMAAEERQAFNINKMLPYERRYNQLAQKAQASNQLLNAGMQNVMGAGQTYLMGRSMQGSYGSGATQDDYTSREAINRVRPSTYRVPLATY